MLKQVKCKYCGKPGRIIQLDDLYYARCTNCCKWSPYEFLGATSNTAIKEWNLYNDKILTNKESE